MYNKLHSLLAITVAFLAGQANADSTINALGSAAALAGTESVPIFQSSNPAVKTSTQSIANLLLGSNNAWTGTNTFGTVSLAGTTFSGITGSTQCLHVNTSGVLSGTGSDCGSGGGSGTVTSVGLALPNIFTISGSPVTTSGTLTGALATETANTVFSGPTTGAAAAPTFRALVGADIPIGQGLAVVSAAVASNAPDRTVTANTTIASTDMAGQVNYNGSSITATIPAISSSVFAAGMTATIENLNATALTISTTPTVNGCPASASLGQYGFINLVSNGTSLDATCFPGFGTITNNALTKFSGTTGLTAASGVTENGTTLAYNIGAETLGANGTATGSLQFFGTTSGSAKIKVLAAAGSPADLVLPTTSGSNGQVLQTDGSGNTSWTNVSASGTGSTPTRQLFTSGTSQTYTTPTNATLLRIKECGAGGGSGGLGAGAGAGGTGGTTSFNSVTVIGGSGGAGTNTTTGGAGGVGGTGGTGSLGTGGIRIKGGDGNDGANVVGAIAQAAGGSGGGSYMGAFQAASASNNGAGADGDNSASTLNGGSGGGGGGECAEVIIASPSATYTYSVGAAGTAGAGATAGLAGNPGVIIVDEYYGATTISVTDGTTTVNGATQVNFTSGATVTNSGGGVASVAVSGGGSSTPAIPQGRLTLTTQTPVMTADATAQGTLYYDNYNGNKVPYYTGSADASDTISGGEVSTAMQTTGTGVLNNAGVFDVWWVHGGANRICVATNGSGGGWASDTGGSNTARGTGYSQVHNTRGYWTNQNSIAHCYNGTTDYGSVNADQATYLGSIYTTAAGKTGMQFAPAAASGGSNNILGVWNAYNRVTFGSIELDNEATYTLSSTTFRAVGGSNSNRISWVEGLPFSTVRCTMYNTYGNGAANPVFDGCDLDSTTATPAVTGYTITGTGVAVYAASFALTNTLGPASGLHFAQAVEALQAASPTQGAFPAPGNPSNSPGYVLSINIEM